MKRSKTVGDLAGLGEYERRKQLWARRRSQGASLAVLPGVATSSTSPQALAAFNSVPVAANPTLLNSHRRPLPFSSATGAAGSTAGLRRPLLVPSGKGSGAAGGDRSPPPFPGAPPALRPSSSDPPPYTPHSPRASPPLAPMAAASAAGASIPNPPSSALLSAIFSSLRIAATTSSESLATTASGGRYGGGATDSDEASSLATASTASLAALYSSGPGLPSASSSFSSGLPRLGSKRKSEEELPDIDVLLRDGEEEEEDGQQQHDNGLGPASPGAGWSHCIVDPAELPTPPPPPVDDDEEEEATDDEGLPPVGGWVAGAPSTPTLGLGLGLLDPTRIPPGREEARAPSPGVDVIIERGGGGLGGGGFAVLRAKSALPWLERGSSSGHGVEELKTAGRAQGGLEPGVLSSYVLKS